MQSRLFISGVIFPIIIASIGLADFNQTAYEVGSKPFTICTADFDNDGDLDLAGTCNDPMGMDIYILRNNGNGDFVLHDRFFVDTEVTTNVNTLDFNNDSYMDLAITTGDIVRLYLNDGSGNFSHEPEHRLTHTHDNLYHWYRRTTSSDLNNDGNVDIIIADMSDNKLTIFLGQSGGGFTSPQYYYLTDGVYALDAVALDLNGDSYKDLVIGQINNISVLLNRGDGSFNMESLTTYYVGETHSPTPNWPALHRAPDRIASGDLNGDGRLDIIVTNTVDDDVSVLLNNGDGTLTNALNYNTGSTPYCAVAVDIDGDGDNDITTVNQASDSISILLNNGDGTFGNSQEISTGYCDSSICPVKESCNSDCEWDYRYQPTWICAGDFNNDGANDLAFTHSGPRNASVMVFLNNEEVSSVGLISEEKKELSSQSYPNPFNPECWIPVGTQNVDSIQKVKIYNILGQLVREIKCLRIQGFKGSRVYWDGKDSRGMEVPSGIYFYEVAGEGVRRMVVLR
jgi:hypothetical protein